jgi:pimeloyl-ACP methyl ester carboxylesterase
VLGAGLRCAPVLLLAGEVDLNIPPRLSAEFAGLFPEARLVIQSDAGHSPWLDDAGWFAAAVSAFLDEG